MMATHPFLTFKDDIPRNPLFLLRKHFDLAFLQDGERQQLQGRKRYRKPKGPSKQSECSDFLLPRIRI